MKGAFTDTKYFCRVSHRGLMFDYVLRLAQSAINYILCHKNPR